MATGPSVANSTNAFVPNWEASGKLRVSFSRNIDSFVLPRLVKMVPTPKPVGFWKRWINQAAARITNIDNDVWADGKPRPAAHENEQFEYVEFRTIRRDVGYTLGLRTVQSADEDTVAIERNGKAALAMTRRSVRAIAVATAAASYQTAADKNLTVDHTATTSALSIGDLSAGSPADPRIMNAVNYAAEVITKDTLGIVADVPASTYLWMNPTTARKLAKSQEILAIIKESTDAYLKITGKLHPNHRFGLPPTLYGHEICVDNTVKITTARKATTQTKAFAFPDDKILLGTRYGGVDGHYDNANDAAGTDFSTLSIFHLEDFTVEEFNDQRNRLLEGHVVCDDVSVLTCPATAFYFTAVFTD